MHNELVNVYACCSLGVLHCSASVRGICRALSSAPQCALFQLQRFRPHLHQRSDTDSLCWLGCFDASSLVTAPRRCQCSWTLLCLVCNSAVLRPWRSLRSRTARATIASSMQTGTPELLLGVLHFASAFYRVPPCTVAPEDTQLVLCFILHTAVASPCIVLAGFVMPLASAACRVPGTGFYQWGQQ